MEEKKPHPGCFVCETAIPMVERVMEGVCNESTREHFRASRAEFLKGLRSLLDEKIAHLSKEEAKGTHVTVE